MNVNDILKQHFRHYSETILSKEGYFYVRIYDKKTKQINWLHINNGKFEKTDMTKIYDDGKFYVFETAIDGTYLFYDSKQHILAVNDLQALIISGGQIIEFYLSKAYKPE